MSKPTQPILTRKIALSIVGSLSNPSKMPGYGWSISAEECKVGSILHKTAGTVCAGCYARKGNYTFSSTRTAHKNRLNLFNKSLTEDNCQSWVAAISFLIQSFDQRHFRWFDSGDLQSVEMLIAISKIAKANPKVKFWLPTKEYGIVREFVQCGFVIPKNLNIRLSAYRVNVPAPIELAQSLGCTVSEVTSNKGEATCRAQTSGEGTCGPCRKCWDKKTISITYHKH